MEPEGICSDPKKDDDEKKTEEKDSKKDTKKDESKKSSKVQETQKKRSYTSSDHILSHKCKWDLWS